MLNFLKLLLFIFSIAYSQAQEGPDQYWADYEAAKRLGTVRKPIDYLSVLSTRFQTDTNQTLDRKKNAILWFMATGGKKGFAKRSATPEERSVMEKALMFVALLTESNKSSSFIDIGSMRVGEPDEKIAKHLRKAQEIISSTRVLIKSSLPKEELKAHIRKIFDGEVTKASVSASDFSKIFTAQNNNRVRDILVKNSYFGFEQFAVSALPDFQTFVSESISSARKMFIATERGLYPNSKNPVFGIKGDLIVYAEYEQEVSPLDRGFHFSQSRKMYQLRLEGLCQKMKVEKKSIQTEEDLRNAIENHFGIVEWGYCDAGPYPFDPDSLKTLRIDWS